MNYTKEKWELAKGNDGSYSVVYRAKSDKKYRLLAKLPPIPETEANAYLISAAPDGHKALKKLIASALELNHLVWEDESRYNMWSEESDSLERMCNIAQQALVKAEGGKQ